MITKKLISYLDYNIPLSNASKWDNCGIQTPIYSEVITNITFALDVTFDLINYCVDENINFILCHHPLFLNQEHKENVFNSKILKELEKHEIMVYSAHTNLDNMKEGLNDFIIEQLGYNRVSKLTDEVGIIFEMDEIDIEDLAKMFHDKFDIDVTYYKNNDKKIKRIGFCSGSAGSLYNHAILEKCDVYITGDIKYHEQLECENIGFNLIDVSHTIENECTKYFDKLLYNYQD